MSYNKKFYLLLIVTALLLVAGTFGAYTFATQMAPQTQGIAGAK